MSDILEPGANDRIANLRIRMDLSQLRTGYIRKKRPAPDYHQRIVQLAGKEGDVETFDMRITIPGLRPQDERECTLKQANAVRIFYDQSIETMYQANIMLTARDFAHQLAGEFSFSAERKALIWLATAAYILSKPKLRHAIRTWTLSGEPGLDLDDLPQHMSRKRCVEFGHKFVSDMRGNGSRIFG